MRKPQAAEETSAGSDACAAFPDEKGVLGEGGGAPGAGHVSRTRWRALNLRWFRRFFSWMRLRRISSCSASVISRPSERCTPTLRVQTAGGRLS